MLFLPLIATAEKIDTIIISNGGPGPYCISQRFVDTASIVISFDNSRPASQWSWLDEINSILFHAPLDSGVPIFVTFSTHYHGLPKLYSLFKKTIFIPGETDTNTFDIFQPSFRPSENDLLKVSGFKSIGVSIGSFGQVNIEQGLDISIGGEIRSGTELNAHLTDNGSSLDGATKEISEFDQIFITLKDPSFDITAGDQYVQWLQQGILSGNKKIKGLSVSLHKKNWSTGLFGALSGGKFTTQYIKAVSGIQGPYLLSGNDETGIISPVNGTIRCHLNGTLLREGAEFDFIVDYDFGSITFTPAILVISSDIIKIEYEYKINDYQKIISGTHTGFTTSDSLLSINGILWTEYDNRDRPIDQIISNSDLNFLKNAGDSPLRSGTENAELVHPNDVARDDALYPLYKRRCTLSEKCYFEHVRFNRSKPDSSKGFFRVWFTNVGSNNGEYDTSYSAYYKDYVYIYTGAGMGAFSPVVTLTAPERVTSGEVSVRLNHSHLKADISIAGQEHDKNLFSTTDDNDNLGSSGRISLLAGKKQLDQRSFWITGQVSGISRHFEGELVSAWDQLNSWNELEISKKQNNKVFWETGSGITFFPGISTQFIYGQQRGDVLTTDKINNVTTLHYDEVLTLVYNGSLFRHNPGTTQHHSRTEYISGDVLLKNQKFILSLQEKWRKDTIGFGNGLLGGGLSYELFPLSLKQEVMYNRLKHGFSDIFSAIDSGYQLTWNQSIKAHPLPMWNLEGSTRYYRQSLFDHASSSAFLVNVSSNIDPKSGLFSSHQEYQSNSERSTSFITIPVYTGKGLGTHVYDTTRSSIGDSTLDKFIPHIPGDWIIERREVADHGSTAQVRKTRLLTSWTLDPPKNISGILADIRWEGNLFCEEYIDAAESSFSSWIPGILSLKHNSKNSWSPFLRYSDCSYRQELDWIHPNRSTLSADFHITPSLRQIQSYRETTLETALSINHKDSNTLYISKVHYLSIFHNDSTSSDYDLFNLGIEFIQRFDLKHSLSFYIQENIGIGDESVRGVPTRPFIISDRYYSQINPGIQYHPFGLGMADLSYTLSYVTIPDGSDYRIARGFGFGISHVISLISDFRIGKYFSIRGMYRGELKKEVNSKTNSSQHIFSFEMKAFL